MSICFQNLGFRYAEGAKNILSGLTAQLDESRITILTGTSGCGKSTLLYLAAGIYPHAAGSITEGCVTVNGQDPASLPPAERCRLVGMMFQNPELQFCMDTVKNELVFCMENLRLPPSEMDAKADEALAFVNISHLKHRNLHSLSGGERQKVMLACLFLLRPKWLLLDEPFANIDNAAAQDIARRLVAMHQQYGTGIVAVDHRLDNWLEAADDIRVVQDGHLLEQVMDARHPDPNALEQMGIIVPGRPFREKEVSAPVPSGTPVLELENIGLRYGDQVILQDLNARFYPGRIYAVVGESGCGKSSLFGALAGLNRYTGHIRFDGAEYRPGKKGSAGKLGFVTQNPQDQFVADTVKEEILSGLTGKDSEQKAEEILRGIRLWRYRDISPYMLSQGQQRRLGASALLAYRCRVLVCDEPAYAQDRRNTISIMDALCAEARSRNMALIFSAHDPQLAADYADEILHLEGGHFV